MKRTESLNKSNEQLKQEIEDREKYEEALRESEQRLNRSQEIAHLGSWELDIVKNHLSWSDEVYRIFGLKPQEFKATYEAFIGAIHPEDRAKVDAAYSNSVRAGKNSYEIEHRIVRKSDGGISIVHEKCEHVRDRSGKIIRSIGMVLDITQRKKSEEALRSAEQQWVRTFDSVPDLIAILDDKHRIMKVNKAMAKRLHARPDTLIGLSCFKCVHGSSGPPELCPHILTLKDGKEHIVEVHEDSLGGDFLVSTTPLADDKGRMIGSVHVARDITLRKKAENELHKLVKEKEALLKEVHHRVKNNMQMISSLIRMQSRRTDNEYIKEVLEDGKNRIKSMALVHEMLYKSSSFSDIDLSEYIKRIVDDLMNSFKRPEKNIRFDLQADRILVNIDTALPCGLIANELVSNSLKYAFNKKKEGKISVILKNRKTSAELIIKDDGIGLPQDFNIKSLHSLGLELVETFVKQIDGTLEIDTRKGTEFKINFPVNKKE